MEQGGAGAQRSPALRAGGAWLGLDGFHLALGGQLPLVLLQIAVVHQLLADLLQIPVKGQAVLRAQNYYHPDCPEVDIPLDPLLTPQQNAARYYKDYKKAQKAGLRAWVTERMKSCPRCFTRSWASFCS